ncbi:bifunctional UDP-N-acetylglucosamine diphosphorylase/glucosamine-1-phosphate N-acetyltransferase GlmU [Humidisolicoccus flavus]|uniref:bifunctional UDP-N-acetylglucosamine diphosphorylase/glucosamine-1-phosphate N-acetyltransferase GlmU n=1 Tax=Humidisolicoccus flavus TaxID=3111414 RepID=UPI00325021D5
MPESLAVVVLAAGQGTRMRSAIPKPLHPLAGKTLIGHVLTTAAALTPEHVVTVVRHERERVAEAVSELYPGGLIVDQDEIPGTGRAVEQALHALPNEYAGHVLVLSADVPLIDAETIAEIVQAHERSAASLTVLSTSLENPSGFGRIVRSESGDFARIVEHKDATAAEQGIHEVNAGVYIFHAAALRDALAGIGTDNASQEKYLTDAAQSIAAAGGVIQAIAVRDHWLVAGINDRVQLADAARELNRRIIHKWQLAGVTILDPASTWIDADVSLDEDVTVLPGSQLLGSSIVQRGATIGPDTTIRDTEVGQDATVKRSDVTLAVIGEGATVGPFSYLRPNTQLGRDGKIGAFVETKNVAIGAGSKVPHLSYVGDAELGEGVNFGAGTITANYDDVNKHRTVVGDHVHTSSHTVLVAPVRLGAGAKTGAGAVVRKDVEPGALALTVAPQRNMQGWVEEHRPGTEAARAAAAANSQQSDQA